MIKTITRTLSVAHRDESKRTTGFFEVFLLADTAFIYSLEGNGVLKNFNLEDFKGLMKEFKVTRLAFVMEPKVFSVLQKKGFPFKVERELKYYDLDLYWVTLTS